MDSEATLAHLGIALFVYGTLKKGFPAHEHFFGEDADIIEEAVVRGKLFDLPAGYPALAIPQKDILAVGAAAPLDDVEKRRGVRLAKARSLPAPEETVHGEIVRFGDSERILPALDAFEGFDPEGESLYVRALATAWTASGEACPVWTYVMESPLGEPLPDGKWPPSAKDSPCQRVRSDAPSLIRPHRLSKRTRRWPVSPIAHLSPPVERPPNARNNPTPRSRSFPRGLLNFRYEFDGSGEKGGTVHRHRLVLGASLAL